MRTDRQIMALHAAISRRDWHAAEVAANDLRDHDAAMTPDKPMIALITEREGVCLAGRWKGWLMRRHPDGAWVSVRKLPEADPEDSNPYAWLLGQEDFFGREAKP